MHGLGQKTTLRIVFAIGTIPLMLLAMGLAAASFAKVFRVYSIVAVVVVIVFGVLTGIDSPRMKANLPTPRKGIWERISIGAYVVWMVVLAIILLRTTRSRQ